MSMRLVLSLFVAAGLLSGFGQTARADELSVQGRAIHKTFHRAVVTAHMVILNKMMAPGTSPRTNEIKSDLSATVVDPSGLTVVSLSATDPALLVQNLMGQNPVSQRVRMETELRELTLVLDDGTRVPVEVAYKSKELDLSFLRPKTAVAAPMSFVDLAQSEKADVLDSVIALTRLGAVANRTCAASVERIAAVVENPGFFYIPETTSTPTSAGSPAFAPSGKVLGIFSVRSGVSSNTGMFNVQADNMAGVIVPAADVLAALKQVPAAAK